MKTYKKVRVSSGNHTSDLPLQSAISKVMENKIPLKNITRRYLNASH